MTNIDEQIRKHDQKISDEMYHWFILEITKANNTALHLEATKRGAFNTNNVIDSMKTRLKKGNQAKSQRHGNQWYLVKTTTRNQ